MRKYGEGQERKLIHAVCNQCGRTLKVENGNLKEFCFGGDAVFGYFSRKDGTRHHFDLCEGCYDKLTAGFAVEVEETEDTELM